MAIVPPFDPNQKPEGPEYEQMGSRGSTPQIEYVTRAEARPEDKVTFADHMALLAAVGCAQAIRLLIVFAAVGIIVLVIFLVSHL